MHVLSLFLKLNCCYVIPGRASVLRLNQVHFLLFYFRGFLLQDLERGFMGRPPLTLKYPLG